MKKTVLLLASVILISSNFSSLGDAAEHYALDLVHSNVLFKIKHTETSYFFGRFNDFTADIHWDEEDAGNSQISFTIMPASVDTFNERRDAHLRNPDFFNARQFPEISFTSSEVKKKDVNSFDVSGELVLLGQKRPVSFVWTQTGAGPGLRGDFRRGGISTFVIQRSDFGMNYMLDRLSDEVELTVSLQMIRQ